MGKFIRNAKESSESAGLLISILMRYPEIGAISFNPEDESITLSFGCTKIISDTEFLDVKNRLEACLVTYAYLERKEAPTIIMEWSRAERISVLKTKHFLKDVTKSEIALIISFLQDEFGDCLVKELDFIEIHEDEELILQDEFIGYMLEHFKGAVPLNKLFAFREEGKVHLFKK